MFQNLTTVRMKEDYNTTIDLNSKPYNIGDEIRYTNELKVKLKIKDSQDSILPGKTEMLVKTESG